jgi:hypothetical protein
MRSLSINVVVEAAIVVAMIASLLAFRASCFDNQIDPSESLPDANTPWNTIETPNFTIYFNNAFEDDARKASSFLNSTIESLTKEFSDYKPQKILKSIDCHYYLHPEPNEMAFDGRSVCITRGLDDGRRHAELHFLTHSQYSPQSTDSVGELKKTDHHFFRYVVHEYSSIWLGVIARDKPKGWYKNGNDAPNWFWQGYEEYLGMTLSSTHSRNVTFEKYMAAVKNDPDSVLLARGHKDKTFRIVVQRDYTDGFALLAFMHERFARTAVQSILASEQETFWQAMTAACQMQPDEFYDEYQKWVEKWRPRSEAGQ